MNKKNCRIVFMGTPEFAVESLNTLIKNNYNVVGVVTVPDKPVGRGQKIQQSPVKKAAIKHNIPVLQPEKLKSPNFSEELKKLNADLQIVIAFRMLPEVVWDMPQLGTINLHASLLPQYRGAAPINWAIINGEQKTGLTTFFIQKEIDTGNIIDKIELLIGKNETAGELHDRMMIEGSKLICRTIDSVINNSYEAINQNEMILNIKDLRSAPKIFKNDCEINWNNECKFIHNFIRGLSPYPAAFSTFKYKNKDKSIKIYKAKYFCEEHKNNIGTIVSDGKNNIKIACKNGWIEILELQMEGKKRMNSSDFLKGIEINQLKTI